MFLNFCLKAGQDKVDNSAMSRTETKVLKDTTSTKPAQTPQLDLAQLKTVQWISSAELVAEGYKQTSVKYKAAKQVIPFLSWYLALIEMIVLGMYTFINNLPYPQFVQNIVHNVDGAGVKLLDMLSSKLEWWLDIIIIRGMWFKDSIEPMFEAAVSSVVLVISTFIGFWMWVASLYVRVLKFFVSPVLRQIDSILSPSQAKRIEDSPRPSITVTNEDCVISSKEDQSSVSHPVYSCASDECQQHNGSTSECDSEISALSESWVIGHTDKYGTYYNRMEMKGTAEGRLRAAMYKRIKGQVKLMDHDSWSFSNGIVDYLRHFLQPKIQPIFHTLKLWYEEVADKYMLFEIFDGLSKWMERHYILCAPLNISIYVASMPFHFAIRILMPKKKSKKTRSVRSESLRRRTENTISAELAKELDSPEEDDYVALAKLRKTLLRRGKEGNEDSAIASSIDDYLTSDSNEGKPSVRERVIKIENKMSGNQKQNIDEQHKDKNENVNKQDGSKVNNVPKSTEDKRKIDDSAKENSEFSENDKQPSEKSFDTNSINGSIKEESETTGSSSSSESEDSLVESKCMKSKSDTSVNAAIAMENVSPTSSLKSRRRIKDDNDKNGIKSQRRISFSLT